MPGPAAVPDDSVIFAVLHLCMDKRGWDYVYKKNERHDGFMHAVCRYIDNDAEPSCLFGLFFTKLGYSSEQISHWEGEGADKVLWYLVHGDNLDAMDAYIAWADSPIAQFMTTVQRMQDAGKTWGKAFEIGKELYTEEKNRVKSL